MNNNEFTATIELLIAKNEKAEKRSLKYFIAVLIMTIICVGFAFFSVNVMKEQTKATTENMKSQTTEFLKYLSEYDFISEEYQVEQKVEGDGSASFIGQEGEIYNGGAENKNKN